MFNGIARNISFVNNASIVSSVSVVNNMRYLNKGGKRFQLLVSKFTALRSALRLSCGKSYM